MFGADYLRWRVNEFWARIENLEVTNGKVSHEEEKCVELLGFKFGGDSL